MKPVRKPTDELAALRDERAAAAGNALAALAKATAESDHEGRELAMKRYALAAGQSMVLADLIGRRRLLLEADAVAGRQTAEDRRWFLFATYTVGDAPRNTIRAVVPRLNFNEAVDDLVTREPRLARSAAEVSRIYLGQHGFAMARAADVAMASQVQARLVGAMRAGESRETAIEAIQRLGNFARSYAQTVYRTTLNSAYTAGRMRQAQDPEVAEVIGGFKFVAVLDSNVRPNHRAMHGLTAATTDPIWQTFSPPAGFQ